MINYQFSNLKLRIVPEILARLESEIQPLYTRDKGSNPVWGASDLVPSRAKILNMKQEDTKTLHRIYTMSLASVYPFYVAKAEKKGHTKSEVNEIICWLTGYTQKQLETQLEKQTNFETFFAKAPQPNPSRTLIKGVICGVRVENIKDPIMQEVRYLDLLIDELARGKAMEKILRK